MTNDFEVPLCQVKYASFIYLMSITQQAGAK